MSGQQNSGKRSEHNRYQPPVSLPLDFDKAIEGLLGVKTKGKREQEADKKKPDDSLGEQSG